MAVALAVFVVLGGVAVFLIRPKPDAPVVQSAPTPMAIAPPPTNAAPVPAESEKMPVADKNIMRKMVKDEHVDVSESDDGLVLHSNGNTRDSLHTAHPVRPPFVFRAVVKSDGADLRFYYGLGLVIFNWADNPNELRVHDFATSAIVGYPGQGALSPTEWHEIVFDVRTNGMKISVDGAPRYDEYGFYRNLNSTPGFAPCPGEVTIKSVVVEESEENLLAAAKTPIRARRMVPGDLLPTMTAVDGVVVTPGIEGLTLSDGEKVSGYIKTVETFHAPLVIRTRAKTDALNLRLYFGPGGRVIFNWEAEPGELRVHDPITANGIGVPGKGRILPNQWHDIVWDIQTGGMRVFLDGQLRYQNRADYTRLEGAAGIGTYLSHVTVASFVVEQK